MGDADDPARPSNWTAATGYDWNGVDRRRKEPTEVERAILRMEDKLDALLVDLAVLKTLKAHGWPTPLTMDSDEQ